MDFRPVYVTNAPDGSLCICDMYEFYVAHGQHYQNQIDPTTGRIYRLRGREAPLERLSAQDWHDTLRVVLDGAFFCTQAALPLLKASGQGAIVNIGGLTAYTGAAERVHVVTAKAGLVGLTRALAHDLASDGVTVNCVSPGLIDTVRKSGSVSARPHHHASHKTLLGRRGTAWEVAQSVVFLAGPGARYVTGQVLHANGGAYLGG